MASYDQNLLDEAPRATRAQLQEGYNVDLLEQPSTRRAPSLGNPTPRIPQPTPVAVPLTPRIAESGLEEKPASLSAVPNSRPSFWRSRNGIVTLFVIALIVVGAVVGGAVGGTAKRDASHVNTTGTHSSTLITSHSTPTPIPSSHSSATQGFGGGMTSSAAGSSATAPVAGTQGVAT